MDNNINNNGQSPIHWATWNVDLVELLYNEGKFDILDNVSICLIKFLT